MSKLPGVHPSVSRGRNVLVEYDFNEVNAADACVDSVPIGYWEKL